jgi:hypothetical protein
MVCDPDPVAAERTIAQRMLVARLEIESVRSRAPGNAQFEALSMALWGTAQNAGALRKLMVEFMRANPEEYAPFLGSDFETYLRWEGCE